MNGQNSIKHVLKLETQQFHLKTNIE